MRIGYASNTVDFSHPADKRKFRFWLASKSLPFERPEFHTPYDLVYVGTGTDLTVWSKYKHEHERAGGPNPKVVFDLSDAYLAVDGLDIRDALRGIASWAAGRASRPTLSFKKTILDMLAASDAVVCGSPEQKALLSKYHANVHAIPDYFGAEIKSIKTSYEIESGEVNVFWEGLSHGNRRIFELLVNVLERLPDVRVNLHIVTDPIYCEFSGRYACQPTSSLLAKISSNSKVRVYSYAWHTATFSYLATACDIALVPVPQTPLMIHKPENKLILLWSLGIPAITSETPSYRRAMQALNVDFMCRSLSDWDRKIRELVADATKRRDYMAAARRHVNAYYSRDTLVEKWDEMVRSLGLDPNS